MSEEQKRQWAMILWYTIESSGNTFKLFKLALKSGINEDEWNEILDTKYSFTEQPKP